MAEAVLELSASATALRVRPAAQSGGEQQRVAGWRRALANRTGLSLADERPPTGLVRGACEVMDILQELNERLTTRDLGTHDPEVARRADATSVSRLGGVPGVQSPRGPARAPEQIDLRAGYRGPTRFKRVCRARGTSHSCGTAITEARPLLAIGIGVMRRMIRSAPRRPAAQVVGHRGRRTTQRPRRSKSRERSRRQARPLDTNELTTMRA